MSWDQGKDTIDGLLARRELQKVSPDLRVALHLIASARKHLASASEIQRDDPEAAYAALYDAARKSCAALLQAQGLRPTSRGGHIAVRDAVFANSAR